MIINVPTLLTLLRIGLIPLLVIVWYLPYEWASAAASGIFLACSITDWLDGWVARRYRMATPFGAFLDPVADKLLVAITLIIVTQKNPTTAMAILAAIMIGRELMVSALREWMAELSVRGCTSVGLSGKIKTAAQMLALLLLLYQADLLGLPTLVVGKLLLAVAAALTIVSGAQYFWRAWPYIASR